MPGFTEERRGNLMARIDSAYNYYMSTYANKEVSRYDSHKKSDLRKVYNQIVKKNKEALCTRFRIRRKRSGMRSISRRAPSPFRTWLHPCRIVTVRSTTPSRRRLQYLPMKIKWVSPTSVTEAKPIRQKASPSQLSSLRRRR